MPGLLSALRKSREVARHPLGSLINRAKKDPGVMGTGQLPVYKPPPTSASPGGQFDNQDLFPAGTMTGSSFDSGMGMSGSAVGDPFSFDQAGMSDSFGSFTPKSNGGLKQAAMNISASVPPSITGGTTGATPPTAPSSVDKTSNPLAGINLAAGYNPTVVNGGVKQPVAKTGDVFNSSADPNGKSTGATTYARDQAENDKYGYWGKDAYEGMMGGNDIYNSFYPGGGGGGFGARDNWLNFVF